jgi:hypothetical protein
MTSAEIDLRPTRTRPAKERRATPRSFVHPDVSAGLIVAGKGRCMVKALVDISPGGVGLIAPQRLPPGAVAAVHFQDLVRGFFHSALIRVVAAGDDGDGGCWLHGMFSKPLAPDIARALME